MFECVKKQEALVWVSRCFPWEKCVRGVPGRGMGVWPRGPLPPKPLRDFILHHTCFPVGVSNPVLTPSQLSTCLFPATCHPITQLPVNRGKSCWWSTMKHRSWVSVPFITSLQYPQTWLNSQARGENPRKAEWGQVPDFGSETCRLRNGICRILYWARMLGWAEPWRVNPLLAAWAEFLGTNGRF